MAAVADATAAAAPRKASLRASASDVKASASIGHDNDTAVGPKQRAEKLDAPVLPGSADR
jgi:hypothetical protein